MAAEATRSVESPPIPRTSASATNISTRRRSGTITSSSTDIPSNVQHVSDGSLARREAIQRVFLETPPSADTAQGGSATTPATSPTTPRRSDHPTPTTPSRHTTATHPTSPTNPRSRREIVENAIRAARAEPTTPPPSSQNGTHNNSFNQSPSGAFGVVSWPAHPDMSFSLSVNNHNGGGGVVAPTSVCIWQ